MHKNVLRVIGVKGMLWSDERAFKRALRVLLSLGCHASNGTAQGLLRGTIKKHE